MNGEKKPEIQKNTKKKIDDIKECIAQPEE